MSRWLKSVNNLLENLDGTAENVAEAGLLENVMVSNGPGGGGGNNDSSDGDDDDYDDEEYYDDEEEEDDYDDDHQVDTTDPTVPVPMQQHQQRQRKSMNSVVSELTFSETGAFEGEDEEGTATSHPVDANLSMEVSAKKKDGLKMDQSPRQPKRTFESRKAATTAATLKESLPSLDHPTATAASRASDESQRSSHDSSSLGPPKLPVRKSSSSQPQPLQDQSTGTAPFTLEQSQSREQPIKTAPSSSPAPRQQQTPVAKNAKSMVKPPSSLPSNPKAAAASSKSAPNSSHNNAAKNVNVNAAYAAANSKVKSLQAQLSKMQQELASSQNANQALQGKVSSLEKKVATSEQEIEAQAEELQRAGQEMETMRITAKEEQEDILEDHDDELEELQKDHQAELDKMRQEYEHTIAQWKEQYEREQTKRQQEGGNWNQELEDAVQRERDALKKLHTVSVENDQLKSQVEKLGSQYAEIQTKLEAATEAAKAATARERQAHDDLDVSKASHSRQLQQRQRREAELEQTIAELGSAMALQQQQQQQQNAESTTIASAQAQKDENRSSYTSVNYKEKWEQAREDLELAREQLTIETQRREALQQELQEIGQERSEEVARAQAQRAQNDRKVSDLESTIARLQISVRNGHHASDGGHSVGTDRPSEQVLSKRLEDANKEIRKLSDQLLRHQGLAEKAKSEISALKGRLQTAISRAEEAERSFPRNMHAVENNGVTYDMESGGRPMTFTTRRRIKGNGGRVGRTGVRSIRSVLRLGNATSSSPAMHQVIQTVDAVDSWMVDTGSFMRTEPMARLGFLLYLTILHIWSFALVLFHNVEVEHGDFGSMDSNPRHWRSH